MTDEEIASMFGDLKDTDEVTKNDFETIILGKADEERAKKKAQEKKAQEAANNRRK